MGGLSEADKKLKIIERLNEFYLNYSKFFDSKEDFIFNIESSLKKDEKELLKNESIRRYYNIKVDKIWAKIEEDKAKEIEKYKDIYLRLLRDHEKDMQLLKSSLKEENDKKEQENQKKIENIIQEINRKMTNLEKKADLETEKIHNFTNSIDKQFEGKIEKYQQRLETERDPSKIREIKEKIEFEKKKKKILIHYLIKK